MIQDQQENTGIQQAMSAAFSEYSLGQFSGKMIDPEVVSSDFFGQKRLSPKYVRKHLSIE